MSCRSSLFCAALAAGVLVSLLPCPALAEVGAEAAASAIANAASAPMPSSDLLLQENGASPGPEYMTGVLEAPEIKPVLRLGTGLVLFGATGDKSLAADYQDPSDSPVFFGSFEAYPFPHRLQMEGEYLGPSDQFVDLHYAYRDTVLLRYIRRALHHNMTSYAYTDFDPSTQSPTVAVLDAGQEESLKVYINSLYLRLKSPGFPAHLFLQEELIEKVGDMQQRYLWGSGWYNQVVRATESRTVDWKTNILTLGANSHLGPVEAEYSHEAKVFDPSGTGDMSAYYTSNSYRPAGVYPHNFMPELTGATDTLRLHSSYTGRVVASMTLSHEARQNADSGAEAFNTTGAVLLFLRPLDQVTLTFKYRRVEHDALNRDSIGPGYLDYYSYTTTVSGIKEALGTTRETYNAETKYRIADWASLSAAYSYQLTTRTNNEYWSMPENSSAAAWDLTGVLRAPKNAARLTLRYKHRDSRDPEYNTEAKRTDTASAELTLRPLSKLQGYIKYVEKAEESNSTEIDGLTLGRRAFDTRKLYTNIKYQPLTWLGINAGASYTSYTLVEDMMVVDLLYGGSLYEELTRSYHAGVLVRPTERLSVDLGVRHTISSGDLMSESVLSSVLPGTDTRGTDYTLTAEYGPFEGGWSLKMDMDFTDFNALNDSPYEPSLSDGTASRFLLTASKQL